MGDGKVALILDVFGMAQLGGVVSEVSHHAQGTQAVQAHASESRQLLLLFRSGAAERLAVPLSVVARLEEFRLEDIEQAHGTPVVQYRDRILPLVPLAEQLGLGSSLATDGEPGRASQVIVFADADRQVGLIVDQILDIVEGTIRAATPSERPGIVGSGVVGGRVTDFLDLEHIFPSVDQQLLGRNGASQSAGRRVMLAEASSFSRSLLRNYLELNGYAVVEAGSAGEAIEKLGREKIDVLLSSLDLPDLEPAELLRRIRREPQLARLPVVGLTAEPLETRTEAGESAGFDDYQLKSDRPGTLRSIERLAAAVVEQEAVVEQGR
jgi:two-component system chemotaxis sensor kinase CheA